MVWFSYRSHVNNLVHVETHFKDYILKLEQILLFISLPCISCWTVSMAEHYERKLLLSKRTSLCGWSSAPDWDWWYQSCIVQEEWSAPSMVQKGHSLMGSRHPPSSGIWWRGASWLRWLGCLRVHLLAAISHDLHMKRPWSETRQQSSEEEPLVSKFDGGGLDQSTLRDFIKILRI